jgi:sugar phosphate isomerase/epimerase
MRLGGRIFEKTADPEAWAAAVKRAGYRAADCPIQPGADDATIAAYAKAAAAADIVIAEVGAWSNPISPDETTRRAALDKCKAALALAERIGAVCCVNIAGSRHPKTHNAPHPDNFTRETFDRIVASVREIVDAVQPKRTFYTLETKPTIFPDSAETYLDLLKAVERKAFAVHLDPINMICTVRRFYENARFMVETVRKLGPHIKSCHVKDLALKATSREIVHLDECRPGTGGLDLGAFLREAAKLSPDLPMMMEHLDTAEEFAAAAAHLRQVAAKEGVAL